MNYSCEDIIGCICCLITGIAVGLLIFDLEIPPWQKYI